MGQTRPLDTYVDLDGTTKRYIDMDVDARNRVVHTGFDVLLMVAGRLWPVKERAFMATISTMNRYEVNLAIRFMLDLDASSKYYERMEASLSASNMQ